MSSDVNEQYSAKFANQYPNKYNKINYLNKLQAYAEWKRLKQHCKMLSQKTLKQLFTENLARTSELKLVVEGIELNYSLQLLDDETLTLLTDLAYRVNLKSCIDALFTGANVNQSECKPALHTALRSNKSEEITVNGQNINLLIHETLAHMQRVATTLREGAWVGCQGLAVTDVVNIGIGGSDLGPKMALKALQSYCSPALGYHFISDSDPDSFDDVVATLNPATTLFIVASKSFTTQETLLNMKKAIAWLNTKEYSKHVIAVTADPNRAKQYGIDTVLPIWDWINGRFSFCSAVSLILMIAIGPDAFHQLLAGARSMDHHFQNASFAENMPVLMALIGIWNINFLDANNHLFLVYSKRLDDLIPYLQQLDMESNGKSHNQAGGPINHKTGPIIWGGLGNHAEHAFYQSLYQGSHYTPGDFIFRGEKRFESMNAAAFRKLNALTLGVESSGIDHLPSQYGINKIIIHELTPYSLGALVSLYEHKIYTQSIIWNINAFDQPGIEAGKRFTAESKPKDVAAFF